LSFELTPYPVPLKKRLLDSYADPVKGSFTLSPIGEFVLQAPISRAAIIKRNKLTRIVFIFGLAVNINFHAKNSEWYEWVYAFSNFAL
jgi:hypothetical protein